MERKNFSRAVLIAWVIVAGVARTSLFETKAAAQTSQAQAAAISSEVKGQTGVTVFEGAQPHHRRRQHRREQPLHLGGPAQ